MYRVTAVLLGLFCVKFTCTSDVRLGSEAMDSDTRIKRSINSELNNVWYFGRSFISDVPDEDANRGVLKHVQIEDSIGALVSHQSEDSSAAKSVNSEDSSGSVSNQNSEDVLNSNRGQTETNVSVTQTRDFNSSVTGSTSEDTEGSVSSEDATISVSSTQSEDIPGPSVTVHTADSTDVSTASNVAISEDKSLDPPLLLTELIEAGRLTEAREKARVNGGPFPAHIPSYTGFLTVDKKYNSNLFFWFFPSEKNYSQAPVILWLQGGPGDSSLVGLFNELGPFSVAPDLSTLIMNNNSWHKNHSIIFIDNPVGTGFSFTDSEEGYATNQIQIGTSLYEAVTQFFTLFHELQTRDFYIAGSSYAGKYIPALGHFIHTRNSNAKLKINLKGIAVCSGYTDPINMMGLNEFAYQLGFIDSRVRDEMKVLEEETKQAALDGDNMGAIVKKAETLQLFCRHSKFVYAYNLLHPKVPYEEYRFSWFLRRREVRAHIHVGDVEFTTDEQNMTKVFEYLMEENMVSARLWLEELLENQYKVIYYNGQLDITVTYPMSAKMYDQLKWSGAEDYRRQERIPWYVNGVLAGYMKSGGNFTDVVVRNAGHLVALDQPAWAVDLITRFIDNTLPTSDVDS